MTQGNINKNVRQGKRKTLIRCSLSVGYLDGQLELNPTEEFWEAA